MKMEGGGGSGLSQCAAGGGGVTLSADGGSRSRSRSAARSESRSAYLTPERGGRPGHEALSGERPAPPPDTCRRYDTPGEGALCLHSDSQVTRWRGGCAGCLRYSQNAATRSSHHHQCCPYRPSPGTCSLPTDYPHTSHTPTDGGRVPACPPCVMTSSCDWSLPHCVSVLAVSSTLCYCSASSSFYIVSISSLTLIHSSPSPLISSVSSCSSCSSSLSSTLSSSPVSFPLSSPSSCPCSYFLLTPHSPISPSFSFITLSVSPSVPSSPRFLPSTGSPWHSSQCSLDETAGPHPAHRSRRRGKKQHPGVLGRQPSVTARCARSSLICDCPLDWPPFIYNHLMFERLIMGPDSGGGCGGCCCAGDGGGGCGGYQWRWRGLHLLSCFGNLLRTADTQFTDTKGSSTSVLCLLGDRVGSTRDKSRHRECPNSQVDWSSLAENRPRFLKNRHSKSNKKPNSISNGNSNGDKCNLTTDKRDLSRDKPRARPSASQISPVHLCMLNIFSSCLNGGPLVGLMHILLVILVMGSGVGVHAADEVVVRLGPPAPKLKTYVTIGMEREVFTVVEGSIRTEMVNVSVTDDVRALTSSHPMGGSLWVWPCCIDPAVATLVSPHAVELSPGTGNMSTVLPITVHGHRLGRTSVRFLVHKNSSGSLEDVPDDIPDDILPSSAQLLSPGPATHGRVPSDLAELGSLSWNVSGVTWMLPERGEVRVVNQENPAGVYLSALVLALTAVNMVGIGGQVDGELMIHLLKNPVAISINLLCRFGIIPAVALGVVELLTPNMDSGLGALVLLAAPSEGAGNLLVLLAEADLTLSVTVTCVTNFAAIGMLPLWTILFETRIYHKPGNVEIPFPDAFILFGYMVVALTMGFVFHRKFPMKYHHFWTYLPSLTIFTILFCIIVEIYNANYVFAFISKEIFLVSVLLALSGASFGAAVCFLCQQPHEKLLILSLETGTRTTYFTSTLLTMSLPQPEANVAKTTAVMVTLLSLTPCFAMVCSYRMYRRYTGQDFTQPEYAPPSSCSEEEDPGGEREMQEGTGEEEEEEEEKTDKCLPAVEVVDEKETCI